MHGVHDNTLKNLEDEDEFVDDDDDDCDINDSDDEIKRLTC